jgi:thiamine biosynthesis lipoprotein
MHLAIWNTWGKQPNGEEWKKRLQPARQRKQNHTVYCPFQTAVVTSGNYEKFVEFLTVCDMLIAIDPRRTGIPATGLLSVTVLSDRQSWLTRSQPVFVKAKMLGLNRISTTFKIECIIIDAQGRFYL